MNKADTARGNDGLVLLYEAAMLLEQKDLMKPNQNPLGLQQPSLGLTRAVSLPVALQVSKPIVPGFNTIQVTLPKARQFGILKSVHKPTIGTMPMTVSHRPIAMPTFTTISTSSTTDSIATNVNGSTPSLISFGLQDPAIQRQNSSIITMANNSSNTNNANGTFFITNNATLPLDSNCQSTQQNTDMLPAFGFSGITGSPSKRLLLTSKSSHNELEKTRRAKLRVCIETLRDELPPVQGESSRMTMLSVLMRASAYMKDLEQLSQDQRARIRVLERRRVELQMRRAQLLRMRHHLKVRANAAAAATAAASSRASYSSANSGNAASQPMLMQQHQRELLQRLPAPLQHRVTFQQSSDANFASKS